MHVTKSSISAPSICMWTKRRHEPPSFASDGAMSADDSTAVKWPDALSIPPLQHLGTCRALGYLIMLLSTFWILLVTACKIQQNPHTGMHMDASACIFMMSSVEAISHCSMSRRHLRVTFVAGHPQSLAITVNQTPDLWRASSRVPCGNVTYVSPVSMLLSAASLLTRGLQEGSGETVPLLWLPCWLPPPLVH